MLIRMVLQVNQSLGDPRLDTTADTLTKKHGQFFRALSPGFSMTKWPGYAKEGSRMRFQRRIPEDVRHAFKGAAWVRIPLNYSTEKEAKRSALAWTSSTKKSLLGYGVRRPRAVSPWLTKRSCAHKGGKPSRQLQSLAAQVDVIA